jgi:hypothetical protein
MPSTSAAAASMDEWETGGGENIWEEKWEDDYDDAGPIKNEFVHPNPIHQRVNTRTTEKVNKFFTNLQQYIVFFTFSEFTIPR